LNFEDNCGNLGDDLNLNVFNDNLSLGRTKEQSTIDDSNTVDLTASEIILTPIMEYSDDKDEKDDCDPRNWSEVKIKEDYTEQSDISNDESKNEKIQRSDTTLLVIGRTER
jgi:hypothetical protein